MAMTCEGLIEIPLEDLWVFVSQHHDKTTGEVLYGVPRINKANNCLEVSFAVSTEGHPSEWAVASEAQKEWDALK
jgi:hypothetical protein